MSPLSVTFITTTTTICHCHHYNHHHLSLSSSQPPPSVTVIITTTTTCHCHHHNHHHQSLSSSQPPPSVTAIITTTTISHFQALSTSMLYVDINELSSSLKERSDVPSQRLPVPQPVSLPAISTYDEALDIVENVESSQNIENSETWTAS